MAESAPELSHITVTSHRELEDNTGPQISRVGPGRKHYHGHFHFSVIPQPTTAPLPSPPSFPPSPCTENLCGSFCILFVKF